MSGEDTTLRATAREVGEDLLALAASMAAQDMELAHRLDVDPILLAKMRHAQWKVDGLALKLLRVVLAS